MVSSSTAAMEENPPVDAVVTGVAWLRSPPGQILFRRIFALPVLTALRERGGASTSDLIRDLGGHPATVIRTVRLLEEVGAVRRSRSPGRRHEVRATLTLRGSPSSRPLCIGGNVFSGSGSI